MAKLTTQELEAICKRARSATEGPWKKEESRYEGQWNVTSVNDMHDLSACLCRLNDAEFIANAREDIPKLLAEVEALTAHLSEANASIRDFAERERNSNAEVNRLRKALTEITFAGNPTLKDEIANKALGGV